MKFLKKTIQLILGEYNLYRIYLFEKIGETLGCDGVFVDEEFIKIGEITDATVFSESHDSDIANLASYGGEGAYGFGAWNSAGELVAACWFWDEARYRSRNFWPLKKGQAKLVQINTSKGYQGKGIASSLLLFATEKMICNGFKQIYARIWHSNTPSLKAFEKTGWKYVAFVVEIFPLGRKKPFRRVVFK